MGRSAIDVAPLLPANTRVLAACDLFPQFFRYPGVSCDPINADGSLPYADASFDVVCSLEVIEHIKDQFAFTRELASIVKLEAIRKLIAAHKIAIPQK